jgi:hypothetical protein
LERTPVRIGGQASWVGNTRQAAAVGIMCSNGVNGQLGNGLYRDMIHLLILNTSWTLTVFENGEPSPVIARGVLDLREDETVYDVAMTLAGDTVTIALPDGTTKSVTDERFARVAGPHVAFQLYHNRGLELFPRWESVFVDVAAE